MIFFTQIMTRGIEYTVSVDTDFHVGTWKLTTLRRLLIIKIPTNIHLISEIITESAYVESSSEADLYWCKVRYYKKAFQDLEILS